MAFNVKLTIKLGQQRAKITQAAGSDIAGTADAIEVNIDATKMTKGDAIRMLQQVIGDLNTRKWPLA